LLPYVYIKKKEEKKERKKKQKQPLKGEIPSPYSLPYNMAFIISTHFPDISAPLVQKYKK
jgi:hypothetical protein